MRTMSISLPEETAQFVDGQIAQGHYGSASAYVRELILADERRQAEATLEAALIEGLNSAEETLDTDAWTAIRREAESRLRERGRAVES
jgi:antitoxin ParD1/3/4